MSIKISWLYLLLLAAALHVSDRCSAQAVADSTHKNRFYMLDSIANPAFKKTDTTKTLMKSRGDSTQRKVIFDPKQECSLILYSKDDAVLLKKIEYKKAFHTKAERQKELQNIIFECYDNAFLLAKYDSLVNDSALMKAYLNFGTAYKWAHLKKGNVDEGVLSEVGFREKLYSNKPLYYKNVKKVEEKLITYYENNGYPFASVKLDSIVISGDKISAQLYLEKNILEKIDSVVIKGNAKISTTYIYNYLGIKPGSLYNESQLKKVNSRLAELAFVRSTKPASIMFTDKFNKLVLNLEKKRASQFDGIIGVLPNNQTGKILFTGDVQLKLQNGLGRGELIDLTWQRLQTQTQDLKLRLVYPFLFRTPFGVDYNFKLYKKDTTFLELDQNIGIQYLLTGGNYLKLFYDNKSSTLLSTSQYANATTLPPNADVSSNMYGVGLKYEKLDYRLNPRKGFSILMNVSLGSKDIKKNAKLNDSLYNGLKLKSAVYNGDFQGSYFLPVASRSTFRIGAQAAFLYGKDIFQNEMFRIGGLNSLRGFDEESIYASSYVILSVEYRFILEQNSYLYLFGDQAYYENNSVILPLVGHDKPYGFGVGISFQTKAGIFSISYALGSQQNNPIEMKNGKIHFGIVNYF